MIIVNFSHPLSAAQIAQVAALVGEQAEVLNVPTQVDVQQPLGPQVAALVLGSGLTAAQWQTERIIISPPALNYIAVLLLAELHGRMGYFPTCLRLRPVVASQPPQYEVAELLPLQAVRDAARTQR